MTLPEGMRQVVAGLGASAAFLGAFFGLNLVWWMGLVLAAPVYLAILLLIGRRPEAREVYVADGVTKAELDEALNALTSAAGKMRELALAARGPDKIEFQRMAELFEAIRGHHSADPRDFRHTRRFIRHDLPRLVDTARNYVDLSRKATGANRDRLAALGHRIRGFTPILEKIDQACLENDFMALEVQVDVLGGQLESR
jgi:5-bromo-4-chloroindolyl phosphate hydrolysis protein